MTDRRLTPANARVAAAHLTGADPSLLRVTGLQRQISAPVANLLRAPAGPRDRQLLFGDLVQVYEDHDGWSFVQSEKDDYVGYVRSSDLIQPTTATHWVSAGACHIYEDSSIKSADLLSLSLGSKISATNENNGFLETSFGFIPKQHLTTTAAKPTDPVALAELLIGTPYLWGGNSRFGIDCSGLVQLSLLICGQPCPGDSDQQLKTVGQTVSRENDFRRGDLLFWKGHVAWVLDPETLLHANAASMSVRYENLKAAILRIQKQGEGSPSGHKRL